MNLASIIDQAAAYFGGKPAIIFHDQEISYTQLASASAKVAELLTGRGVKPGDRVAIFCTNRPEWVAAYYGIIRTGAVAVCLSASYKMGEVRHLLEDAGACLTISCEALKSQLPETEALLVEQDPVFSRVFEGEGPAGPPPVEMEADDTCAILYTGGTTGSPKGAMLTHRNIIYTAQNVCYHERTKPDDRSLCFMPLNHVFGGIHIMNTTFFGCGTLVLHEGFDLDKLLASIQEHGVTRFFSVPTVYIRLLADPSAVKKFETVTYCFSAATSMASEIVRQWKDRFNLTIHESYGMTETASLVTFNHLYRHRIGSVGTLAGANEVRLVDLDDNPVAPGETGEIIIRGPNVMKGYYNKPEETAFALRGGWLHSGDIGRFDEDGYLYIVDRIKDMVISGGLNVYPTEVEEVLYTHPAVGECAVVGMPHAEYGEAVTAYIVCKEGFTLVDADLIRHCKAELASYKAPKKIIQVAELPKSPTGKILRRLIREQAGRDN